MHVTQQTTTAFQSAADIHWYRSPIDPETLAALMTRSDLRGWLQTLGHLGLFCLTGTLAYQVFVSVNGANWFYTLPLLLVALFLLDQLQRLAVLLLNFLEHVVLVRWRQSLDSISCGDFVLVLELGHLVLRRILGWSILREGFRNP